MRIIVAICLAGIVAGCAPLAVIPNATPTAAAAPAPPPFLAPDVARAFEIVVSRVEPVAEELCRSRTRGVPCDLRIVVDTRPNLPPNAFQTLDRAGNPVVGFTLALIADARNADEIAFVLGHEAAHHIAGHIPRQRDSALRGALVAGVMASLSGEDEAGIEKAQNIGAAIAARSYSRDFELEADALGTEIAYNAGFDPVRGAAFFSRLPDPGDKFLGTHPPNGQRQALVRDTLARLQAGS